jgi:hypothetical protein
VNLSWPSICHDANRQNSSAASRPSGDFSFSICQAPDVANVGVVLAEVLEVVEDAAALQELQQQYRFRSFSFKLFID